MTFKFKKMNRLLSLFIIYTSTLIISVRLTAQESAVKLSQSSTASKLLDLLYNNILVVLTVLVLLIVVAAGINLIWAMIDIQKISLIQKYGPEVTEKAGWGQKTSWWTTIYDKLSGLKPLEKEKDIELHHDYDGIRELDNSLPPWWVYLFYITIVWAFAYLIYYHVGGWGNDQEKEYVLAIEKAEVQKAAFLALQGEKVDEKSVTLLTKDSDLAEGKDIFLANCIACHGSFGEGNAVGPNLTDKYWLHGGSIKQVFSTIKYGVQEKGMQSWQTQLRPVIIQKVASYILSLQDSNPPNAKAPQGELYIEVQEEMPADTITVDSVGQIK